MTWKPSANLKAIIFDLDETLLDAPRGLEASHEAVADWICDHFSLQDQSKRKKIFEELEDFDDRMNRKTNYDRNDWWPKFVEEMGLEGELTSEEVERLTEIYWNTYAEEAKPYPQAEPVLKYLSEKGYSLGVLTDTDGWKVPKRKRIEPLPFANLFDGVVIGGEDTEKPKPDPTPYKMMLYKLNLTAEECVMVGDKPFTDIKGAKNIGMKTILVPRREWDVNEEPDLVIDSLGELREFF